MVTEGLEEGAIIKTIQRYMLGSIRGQSKVFAPTATEFYEAALEENINWDGLRKRDPDEMVALYRKGKKMQEAMDFGDREAFDLLACKAQLKIVDGGQ